MRDSTNSASNASVYTKGVVRYLLIAGGTACVGLGFVGMFVPLLPTTPLLLLAAICYARSSERFYHWLLTNRWCGEYIRNYREGRGIPLKQKILAIVLMWATIGYAVWFVASAWWLRTLLIGISIGVTIHLMRIRTFRPEAGDSCPVGESSSPEDGVKENSP